jgi:hypothetical protein
VCNFLPLPVLKQPRRYIAEQPFQSVKQLVFDILLGQKALCSAWNPGLEQGTIMVSLMNAPLIRFSFSVNIFSDHVKLAGAQRQGSKVEFYSCV